MSEATRLVNLDMTETALEQRAFEFYKTRLLLGNSGKFTESSFETRLLNDYAGVYGCVDADEVVSRLGLAWNQDPASVRKQLIFSLSEAMSRVEEFVKKSDSADLSLVDFNRWIRKNSISLTMPAKNQKPPTSHQFPRNEEIADHHDKCAASAAEIRKQALPLNFFSRTKTTAPISMTSSASIDELSEVSLECLLGVESSNGLKILLTVVQPAFIFSAVTAIVADSTGQHVRIAIYNSNATNTSQAQQMFPVGAQFYLKQPFLKRCADQWLGLRVDDPTTLVRLDVPLYGNVLVVGDGDLSFSGALEFRNGQFGALARITASTLDTKEALLAKYDKASQNLDYLSRYDSSSTVLHEIDATDLQNSLVAQLAKTDIIPAFKQPCPIFNTVVWNFPYPVGVLTVLDSSIGALLVQKFFLSVQNVLKDNGEVRITLATRQGGSSREAIAVGNSWSIENVARKSGFDLIEVFPFDETLYPTYEPRREFKDESFPYQNARVHVFKRSSLSEAGENANQPTSTEKHLVGRIASFIQGASSRFSRLLPQRGARRISIADLEEYPESAAARSLLVAATNFQQAKVLYHSQISSTLAMIATLVPKGLSEKGLKGLSNPHLIGVNIVVLVAAGFAVRDGELVAEFSGEEIEFMHSWSGTCVKILILDALPHAPRVSWEATIGISVSTLLKEAAALKLASEGRTVDGIWYAPYMSTAAREDVASCVFAHASLQMMALPLTSDLSLKTDILLQAVCMLTNVIAMGIEDVRIHRLRASLLGFLINQADLLTGNEDEKEITCSEYADMMIADSEAILKKNPSDVGALYSKAFALRSGPFRKTADDSLDVATLRTIEIARDTYVEYLKLTEKDDRFRPAANYHVGFLSLILYTSTGKQATRMPINKSAIKDILGFYNEGLKAESRRLPLFGPVGPVDSKEILSLFSVAQKSAASRR